MVGLLMAITVAARAESLPPMAAFLTLCADLDGEAIAERARSMGLVPEGVAAFAPPPPAAWRLQWVEEERLCTLSARGSDAATLRNAFRAEAAARGWTLSHRWSERSGDNFLFLRNPGDEEEALGVHSARGIDGGEEVALTRRPAATLPDFYRR